MGTGITVSFDRQTSLERNTSEAMCVTRKTNLCSRLVQYFSVAMVAMMVCYLLNGSSDKEISDSTDVLFLHLFCLAAHFGTQCWVTFVAGFTMFFSLPRIMFGRLQSRLFPVYFGTTLMLSCVTLVTYIRTYRYEAMSPSQTNQLILLVICVVCTFINSFFLAPCIVDSMVNMFELEKESGLAYSIGYCDRSELKKNADYCLYYKQFRRVHGISGITNIITLLCNAMYIYSLASLVSNADILMKYCEKS